MGPMGMARRRGRRRGLIVGAAVGAAAARRNGNDQASDDAGSSQNDQLAELERLAKLHEQGVLTDEEFQAQKQKILNT